MTICHNDLAKAIEALEQKKNMMTICVILSNYFFGHAEEDSWTHCGECGKRKWPLVAVGEAGLGRHCCPLNPSLSSLTFIEPVVKLDYGKVSAIGVGGCDNALSMSGAA